MIYISNIAREIQAGFFNTEPYVPQKIIKNAGKYDGKYATNVSLASHIINATLVGANCYAYDKFIQDEEEVDDEELRVLFSALALHDVNKYVNEKYGWNKEGNDEEVLEKYFEDDDFGIEDFLRGGDYFDDLLYLIQRTEVKEDSTSSRGVSTKFRHLAPYCRRGDAVASKITKEGIHSGAEYLKRQYSALEGSHVHLLEFTAIEQPILNELLLSSVKAFIAGEAKDVDSNGVNIGSTSEAILYLGEKIESNTLKEKTETILGETIPKRYNFSCKLSWNTFDYDILSEISIPYEEKKAIIAEEFEELLKKGPAGVEAFEHVPNEFREYLPSLGQAIYQNRQREFEDSEVQKEFNQILDEQGPQKLKIHFIAHLLETYPRHKEFLETIKKKIEPKLQDNLEPESDALKSAVNRFFGKNTDDGVTSKKSMCFLCGREAKKGYQKGHEAFYRTQSYSRRVKPHEKYKNICEVCNLEYALLADTCRRNDINLRNDVEVVYFYYDDFVGDLRLYDELASPVIQGETTVMDEPNPSVGLFSPQYHIQPFYVIDRNHRLNMVRETFKTIKKSGMKAIIGKPFSRFDASKHIFEDEESIRQEEILDISELERYESLERPINLFDLMATVGAEADLNKSFLELDRDEFHSIADFVVKNHDSNQPLRNTSKFKKAAQYIQKYQGDELMNMKEVAASGINLFGKQYDSKYKKTKIFRECLDSFLSGMSQGMKNNVLIEHVAGQVYDAAKREEYAGHVEYEDTMEFVKSVQSYLKENDLYDLKRMSDWENALINSYYFVYDQIIYGDNNEN